MTTENQTPTAQSGPSDRAIAQAFREVTGPDGGKIGNDYVVDYIQQRAAEIDAATPPAGARDAVTDEMVERALNAQPLVAKNSGLRVWQMIDGSFNADEVIRAALEAALTGKADGGDILIDDVPLSELQYGKEYFATIELPDDIRVPLDELWADAAYLVGRVQVDGSFGPAAVESIKRRIDDAKLATKCALHAATQPAAPGAVEGEQLGYVVLDDDGWEWHADDPIESGECQYPQEPMMRMTADQFSRMFPEPNTAATGMGDAEDMWPLAMKVWDALNRVSCPSAFMDIAVQTISPQNTALAAQPAPVLVPDPVAWSLSGFIHDDDGTPIGTDEPRVIWGVECPDETEGWSPLYGTPAQPAPVVGGDARDLIGQLVSLAAMYDQPLAKNIAERLDALLAARPGGEAPIGYVDAGDLQGLTLGHYGRTSLHSGRREGDVPLYAHPAQAGGEVES